MSESRHVLWQFRQSSKEFEWYLANSVIEYNRTPHQRYSQNCEQLCLQFLRTVDKKFKDIELFNSMRLKYVADVYADRQE